MTAPNLTPEEVLALLKEEVLAYRDELKPAGVTLTVGDTKAVLDAYQRRVSGRTGNSHNLTDVQKELLRRLTARIGLETGGEG
jgi:hypothetical protein